MGMSTANHQNRPDTETNCHCGAPYKGSDHCPECGCEQYESGDCGHTTKVAYCPECGEEFVVQTENLYNEELCGWGCVASASWREVNGMNEES